MCITMHLSVRYRNHPRPILALNPVPVPVLNILRNNVYFIILVQRHRVQISGSFANFFQLSGYSCECTSSKEPLGYTKNFIKIDPAD